MLRRHGGIRAIGPGEQHLDIAWTSPLPTARSGIAYTAYQGIVPVVGGEARATGRDADAHVSP